jgi:hypothetical protein
MEAVTDSAAYSDRSYQYRRRAGLFHSAPRRRAQSSDLPDEALASAQGPLALSASAFRCRILGVGTHPNMTTSTRALLAATAC